MNLESLKYGNGIFKHYHPILVQRIFWVRWWNRFPKEDIPILANNIKEIADSHFHKYQITSIAISNFLRKSSLNPFDLVNDQIKPANPNISEQELMIKCMEVLKEQFVRSFQLGKANISKDDHSTVSITGNEEEEHVLAGEDQSIEDTDVDINEEKLDIHDQSLGLF